MKVVTWNIHSNKELTQLGSLAKVSDIICLQEVHGNIIDSWKLQLNGTYYEGSRKIGVGQYWNIIYWNKILMDTNKPSGCFY